MADRAAELAQRHGLDEGAVRAFRALLDVLACDPTAPTTVRDPAAAADVHLADSLAALALEPVRDATTLADLGAGAGFPGLALAAALPRASAVLIESVRRKCEFIERAARAAGLGNVTVACARAEVWTPAGGGCDLVTARALAPLAVVEEYAAPLLRLGGSLVAWKGALSAAEEADAAAAAAELGLELREVRPVRPFPASERRTLHLYSKVTRTPARFPRRPGIARKRPLRAST
jgi:16S rRNA (guanine527-N7)-methyltransferase